MSLKGLPIIKCLKCGRTVLKDQYELSGCPSCKTTNQSVDFGEYRRRESLSSLSPGYHTFSGRFCKVGNLIYKNRYYYAHIEHITDEHGKYVSNHTYVPISSREVVNKLKETQAGSIIKFNARVNCYNHKANKWGIDKMNSIIVS